MAATYTPITSSVLSVAASTVTLSGIPSTYKDLVLRMSLRSASGSTTLNGNVRYNNSSSANYNAVRLEGNASLPSSARDTGGTADPLWYQGDATGSNIYASVQLYMPNYAASTAKQFIWDNQGENNDTGGKSNFFVATYWNDTTAVSSLTLLSGAGNFMAYSSFRLYGIKNS